MNNNIEDIFNDWDDEEFNDDIIEYFRNFNEKFVIEISKNKWDDFVDFINENKLKINNRGVENFTRYLDKCDEFIYLFVNVKRWHSPGPPQYRVSYYSDKRRFEDGDYLKNKYKTYYSFENKKFEEVENESGNEKNRLDI